MLSILNKKLWHDKIISPSILTFLGIRAFIPHSPYWKSLQVRTHNKHIFMNLKTYKQMQEPNNSILMPELSFTSVESLLKYCNAHLHHPQAPKQ
jgi:hypothetical protein